MVLSQKIKTRRISNYVSMNIVKKKEYISTHKLERKLNNMLHDKRILGVRK